MFVFVITLNVGLRYPYPLKNRGPGSRRHRGSSLYTMNRAAVQQESVEAQWMWGDAGAPGLQWAARLNAVGAVH